MILGMDSVIAAAVAVTSLSAQPSAQPQWVPGTRDAVSSMNSQLGPTGLVAIPTAYSVDHKEGRFGSFFGNGIATASGNYGLIRYVEVGGAYIDRTGANDKAIANAKVTLIPSNFGNFEIGIGVIDAFDAIEQTFYVVASADLVTPKVNVNVRGNEYRSIGLKVHAGAGNGMFDDELFAGGELLFTKNFSVVGEWDTSDFNAALRYAHEDHFSLQLGFYRTDFFLSATTRLRF